MLNTIRHQDFFNPINFKQEIHIIGIGAVGSHIADAIIRLGIKQMHIWDFDTVDEHNIPNQLFTENDIGLTKVDALEKHLININKDIKIIKHNKYTNELLKGILFSCVDNIEVRSTIYETNEFNPELKAIFDTRIGLEDGQVFSADWSKSDDRENLLAVSDFKHEEVEEPTSICGTKLTVLPTVRTTATYAISNFLNFVKSGELKRNIIFNPFNFTSKSY